MNKSTEVFLWLVAACLTLSAVLGVTCLVAAVAWFLYNHVVVPCIPALPHVGFWATWAILGTLRILALVIRGK